MASPPIPVDMAMAEGASIHSLFIDLGVYTHLLAILLGMPRLFIVAQTVPFFASGIITGQIRTAIVFALYMPLHFMVVNELAIAMNGELIHDAMFVGALIFKEVMLGLLIAYISAIPFYAIMSAGFLVDNQRGASMASTTDPASSEQTTPLGAFLLQTMLYVFYTGGGFVAYIVTLYGTYELWPIAKLVPLNWPMDVALFYAKQMCWLVLFMLLLAGPIVITCLMADMSLGLVNRFASQLNVYVLAMPVKSGVAAFLLVGYYAALVQKIPQLLLHIPSSLLQLHRLLP